ncbi:hypothetical protein Pfo_029204, partial [Paulownia fortunei]
PCTTARKCKTKRKSGKLNTNDSRGEKNWRTKRVSWVKIREKRKGQKMRESRVVGLSDSVSGGTAVYQLSINDSCTYTHARTSSLFNSEVLNLSCPYTESNHSWVISSSIMPAKHILELVLDTLQRRDTYEIFAEPVDPDEVEDYYEIIKEPMDFGTMRAKLHEGMYENLEQFEHDVFLIPENAMHFNSSATIYFRQARAIQELAKKVFHALKTDPENFVSEFSGTRRRSMRKALSDTKDSRFSMAKSGSVGSDMSSKGTLHSPSTSTFRRTSKKSHGCTGMGGHFYARNFLTGNSNSQNPVARDLNCSASNSSRSTNNSNRSSNNNNNTTFAPIIYSLLSAINVYCAAAATTTTIMLGPCKSFYVWSNKLLSNSN